jgi:L-alanine-DL-glutamate epimerase-like enolase superfamily enzyme
MKAERKPRSQGITRRAVLRSAGIASAAGLATWKTGAVLSANTKGIRIEGVSYGFEEYSYRTPYKFGGRAVDRVTLLNVRCRVRTQDGRDSNGFGSMPLGNVWAFPSKVMSYDTTLEAMKYLAERISRLTSDYREFSHPIDINHALEPHYLKAAVVASAELKLASPIPKLCTLVTASPFDAAIHDAYGKAHGLNCYLTYGPDHMTHDLSHYLGADFKGEFLERYVKKTPSPRTPLFHSVGAGDPITDSDIQQRLNDGLPETLPEWIRYNGLIRIKIKLNGENLEGDLERTLKIDRVTEEAQKSLGVKEWFYCLDFNENCPNVGFVLEFLRRLKEKTPDGFTRIQYVEQPTARDLKANRSNVMHEAAKLRPVVIDESLTDLESLLLAREMGYTGAALKACKGQSQAMLMAAACQRYKMYLCVQDLTCPGASFIHNAGIAAHVPGASGIEGNSREYVPAANKPWLDKFPGLFRITDGTIDTSVLTGPGLSAV